MKIVFADQPLDVEPPSLFLAGPTPRSADVPSWRPEAIELLKSLDFKGTVLVPERRDWSVQFAYLDQVEWEYMGLETCSVVVFWVPRHLKTLPGFTTNVEFGRYVGSGRCAYGRPAGAPQTRYLALALRETDGQTSRGNLAENPGDGCEDDPASSAPG